MSAARSGLLEAVRAALAPVRESFRLTHLAGTELSVAACEARVLRAKVELAEALDARDRARAAVDTLELAPRVPAYLLKKGTA